MGAPGGIHPGEYFTCSDYCFCLHEQQTWTGLGMKQAQKPACCIQCFCQSSLRLTTQTECWADQCCSLLRLAEGRVPGLQTAAFDTLEHERKAQAQSGLFSSLTQLAKQTLGALAPNASG